MQEQQDIMFDKYTVRSKAELKSLHAIHPLEGAYMITGDLRHIRLHGYFNFMQKVRHVFHLDISKTKPDSNLCHNMICVGWDDAKDRPILAHVVMDGLKVNATCYFTYKDNDVDYINVYIPKNHTLKDELLHNSDQTAALSTNPKTRSPFSWVDAVKSSFLSPRRSNDRKLKHSIAVTLADIFLYQPLRNSDNTKPKGYHCAHYAVRMMQVSMILQALDNESRLAYSTLYRDYDRAKLITIFEKQLKDERSALGAAYARSVFAKLDPSRISSADVDYALTSVSDCHASFFQGNLSRSVGDQETLERASHRDSVKLR